MKVTTLIRYYKKTIGIVLGCDFLIYLLLWLFHSPFLLILLLLFFLLTTELVIFFMFFYTRKSFYHNFLTQLEQLDQKYLITELIRRPSFLEGQILYDNLYKITKCMIEHINEYQYQLDDYKNYLEMWIHEIKLPLSNILLHLHNQTNHVDPMLLAQLKMLEDYIDQILYYSRAEYAEVDYFIQKCSLEKIVQSVILRNKDSILLSKVSIHTNSLHYSILTDAKWLAFIMNQIISNSIKYQAKNISISATQQEKKTIVAIRDDGMGISQSDLPKVFEKSYTGKNGHNSATSTGMGLYICHSLCKKLGHLIEIQSKQDSFTEVQITFLEPDFYDTVR